MKNSGFTPPPSSIKLLTLFLKTFLRKQRKKIRKALNKIKRINFPEKKLEKKLEKMENKSLDLRQKLYQQIDEKKTHFHSNLIENKESMKIEKSKIIQELQEGLPINCVLPSNLKPDGSNKIFKKISIFIKKF